MDTGRKYWVRASVLLTVMAALMVTQAAVRANVRLVFDSTSLDFGNVAVLGARDLTFDATDTSGADIEIDAITPTGPNAGDFIVLSPKLPVVVNTGQTIATQIIIRFGPQASGTRLAQLEIETSDGEVIIPLTGFGAGNEFELALSVATVDFGTSAPGAHRDSTIELYSDGTDTAEISDLEMAAVDTSFSASIVNGPQPPFKLGPGDSVTVQIAFDGEAPAGLKFAQLSAFGSTQISPACNLAADVEFGGFEVTPATIDFGAMYDGEVRDTTVFLIDTSAVDLVIQSLDLSPGGEDFSIATPLDAPFTIHAGDTLPISIRANPGAGLITSSQLLVISLSALRRLGTMTLTVAPSPAQISAPAHQDIAYYCASGMDVRDSVTVTNSGTRAVIISGMFLDDSSAALQTAVSFPDTIEAESAQTLSFEFDPSVVSSGALVLELLGGEQVMLSDTIALHPTTATAAPVLSFSSGNSTMQYVKLAATTLLQPFGLDSIIVHLFSLDSNVATIDAASIHLDSALASDTIVSIKPEPGGYRIVIGSSDPISATAGIPFLDFGFRQFISSGDSTAILAAIETPERTGCIEWAMDTLNTGAGAACGAELLRDALSHQPIILDAVLEANPIVGRTANLRVDASAESDARFEISNVLGEVVSTGSISLKRGANECSVPADFPSGSYRIRLLPVHGIPKFVSFVKLR